MIRRLMALAALCFTLALWSRVVWNAHSAPLDLGRFETQVAEIALASEVARELDAAIARAHLEWDPQVPALSAAAERWQDANEGLVPGRLGLSDAGEAATALRRHRELAERARRGIAGFRQTHARLIREFDAMQEAGQQGVESLVARGASGTREVVFALMEEIAGYCLQSSPDNRPAIEDLLGRLGADLLELQDRVRLVMALRDEQQAELDRLLAQPLAGSVASVRGAMLNHQMDSARAGRRNLVIMSVFGSGLLLIFGVIGLRLRSSLVELDGLNVNLEELVGQRTRELNAALEEVKMQQSQLVQSEKLASLGQLVAGVAHEINTPLGYARSNVESVIELQPTLQDERTPKAERDELGAELDMLLQDSLHGLNTIGDLVMSLRNFSRVDRSMTELFDINECLDTCLDICRHELSGRITVQKDYAQLPRIPCAPSKLNQVFLNIINNAAQAIDGEGRIHIRTLAHEDAVEVGIADSGCGMDEHTAAHLFEPFFTTKPVGQGTGLGMSIAYRIIEDHGGTCSVRSAPGEGAEIVIRLPLQAPVTADAPVAAEPATA